MPTYVSMVTWCGDPRPRIAEVEAAIGKRAPTLRSDGLRSVTFLPEDGACSAVMVLTCDDEVAAAQLAASVMLPASVYVESMLIEDAERDARARVAAGRHGYGRLHRALVSASGS